jgi:hypothetical protein
MLDQGARMRMSTSCSRQRVAAVTLLPVLVLLLGGCGDDGKADSGAPATEETSGPAFALPSEVELTKLQKRSTDGAGCNTTDLAEELPEDALVGEWGYVSATFYEDGYDYYTEATGDLSLTADGRWEGSRTLVIGAGAGLDPVYSGPGDWEFDGRTLVLSYDDGSTETYTGVIVGEMVDSDGVEFRALTLEAVDGDTCTTLLLAAES